MSAYSVAVSNGGDGTQFLKNAKDAEAALSRKYPNYVMGQFLCGSFWYGLREYDEAAVIWCRSSSEWVRAMGALALLRSGKRAEAIEIAKNIEHPSYRLMVFPAFLYDERGKALGRETFGGLKRVAASDATYRTHAFLPAAKLLGLTSHSVDSTGKEWLVNWPEDEGYTWTDWERDAIRYFCGQITEDQLLAASPNESMYKHSNHFCIGLDALVDNQFEKATTYLESSRVSTGWESAWLGAVWSNCLLDFMNQRSDTPQQPSSSVE